MVRSAVCDLVKIFKSSVNAVLPENLIKTSVKYNPDNQLLSLSGDHYTLHNKNVYLIGAGKAVQNMAKEVEIILSDKIKHGIVSIPFGSLNCNMAQRNISYCEGAKNNLPDTSAEITATKIRELVTKLGSNDILLVLISGGGSALLPLPKPPITLDEKTSLIKSLANSGADITELNTVRKRLSDLKGGELSIKAQPAQVISLILSDIVGDPLDLIASGPTTENVDDPLKAISILNKYKLYNGLPESIKSVLNTNMTERKYPQNVKNYVIGSNKLSIEAALDKATKLNYFALSLSYMVTGNVKDVAYEYVKLAKSFVLFLKGKLNLIDLKVQLQSCNIPGIDFNKLDSMVKDSFEYKDLCIIFGGETTVEVKGNGKGGRNQQLALEFSKVIDQNRNEFEDFDVVLLSAGTDGIDGPTDAAGAIGHLDLVSEAKIENLDVQKYLDDNDSYSFFQKFNKGSLHVMTGHTNTNVMDIHLIIIKRK